MPAVLLVHGGGWYKRTGDMEGIAKDLARSGYFVFNITYRLAPTHHFPDQVNDVKDAIKFLQREASHLGIDPNRIAGWGYSAGANLIMLAGLDPKNGLRAIVGGGTPANLVPWPDSELVKDFIGGSLAEKRSAWEAASPLLQIKRDSPPIFLYHGKWDNVVEIEQMREFARALRKERVPVETHEVTGGGHLSVYLFSQESVDLAVQFLDRRVAN
ncbi:MAG: alpha/beta hydrolase [Proteobacteria bacterium]|nr:MAG: alpha/beta hydrolase [Pseudomonadota bacterium]